MQCKCDRWHLLFGQTVESETKMKRATRTVYDQNENFCIYEAHPQSKFPWGRVQKQNTIAWKYLLQQIQQAASVQLFSNIFATGIETFVIPWDQLLYTMS
jgi:hypothetical protein